MVDLMQLTLLTDQVTASEGMGDDGDPRYRVENNNFWPLNHCSNFNYNCMYPILS